MFRFIHSVQFVFLFALFTGASVSGQVKITSNTAGKVVVFGNHTLEITLDYDKKCMVTAMMVNGESVLSGKEGMFSGIRTAAGTFSTCRLEVSPEVSVMKNEVNVSGIRYGTDLCPVEETWTFLLSDSGIRFEIERTVDRSFQAEEVSFPSVVFNSIHTWDGAFLGYGGLAWFYLFNEKLCTYGVHTGSSVFWNSATGNGLSVAAGAEGKEVASTFTRTADDQLLFGVSVSDSSMKYRYDAGTNRRRFIRQKTDVWHAFSVPAGTYRESLVFSYVNYKREYNRGHFVGINGDQVTRLSNTIARIGVIDARHFGGNSWHTPYGPICLHEQYIAQLGLAIDDPHYIDGYAQCLDYYRDNAIQPDGRVLARWAYTDEDAMPGTATPKGFYEAQWGYLMDSNPDFVTDVSELYRQSGDSAWVRKQKTACEKALDYMLKRDADGNHLVEMMTDYHTQKRGSDWIDIIWASYENAFVNAKLYYALALWSGIEKQLGDGSKATYYSSWASALKTSFNRPTTQGGFWDAKNGWYVHWLDKDHSVHGDNLMIPVNFMAIAYGICDDEQRKKAILDKVEEQMEKEKLFAWPLCMYTYAKGEGNDWQFPFPNYENGDIFLSWGGLGVEVYASYKPELALKYVENILARYAADGLAFQRYGRLKQDGLGDDILSGNSLAIAGLYKSVYGINPMPNRMVLDPHMPGKLLGTTLYYRFRGDRLTIHYEKDRYAISNARFRLVSPGDFGFSAGKEEVNYFFRENDSASLRARVPGAGRFSLEITEWKDMERAWKQTAAADLGQVRYTVCQVQPGKDYDVFIDGRPFRTMRSDNAGCLVLEVRAEAATREVLLKIKK